MENGIEAIDKVIDLVDTAMQKNCIVTDIGLVSNSEKKCFMISFAPTKSSDNYNIEALNYWNRHKKMIRERADTITITISRDMVDPWSYDYIEHHIKNKLPYPWSYLPHIGVFKFDGHEEIDSQTTWDKIYNWDNSEGKNCVHQRTTIKIDLNK